MTCGKCKYCVENNVCNGDCLCRKQQIDVSAGDDIRFYGELGKDCDNFEEK